MNALLCVALLVPAYGDKDIRKALEDAGVRECIREHFVFFILAFVTNLCLALFGARFKIQSAQPVIAVITG
jgi:hypothetical protein